MRSGDVLNSLFKCAKWLALLTCVVFLASVLDNVPDCPELLNQKAASMAIHFDTAVIPDSPYASFISTLQLPVGEQSVICERPLRRTCCVSRSFSQAADPSPPLT